MTFFADLHVHSRFSRATSKKLDPEHMALWARKKGISVVGTGDFTHPVWISELQEKLVEAEDGLYRLRPDLEKDVNVDIPPSCQGPVRFMLSSEISCIYKKNGLTRKLHHVILMPDFESVIALNQRLDRIGNIVSDGRPILGLDSRSLLEITLEVNSRAFFIPAHIWTPWFSLFGSKSGFDTIEECFEDLTGHIHALETGLSSDPPMNRLLSGLDGHILVSNSDAHSPSKLGREANIFDTPLEYGGMVRAMTKGTGFIGTVEFFPEEGKYHMDGHRKCRSRLHPRDTKAAEGRCPVCGRPPTIGVLHRVHDLADRRRPKNTAPFFYQIPLHEVLSELLQCGPGTKKVETAYEKLLASLGPELHILMDAPLELIEDEAGSLLSEAIQRIRNGRVMREGGYDGEYGTIRLFESHELHARDGQMALFEKKEQKAPAPSSAATVERVKGGDSRRSGRSDPVPSADPILGPLNSRQKQAVLNQGGRLLVTAGPGTGKTMTLAHAIAHLIREGLAHPDRILALTFTRKAAAEMKQRVNRLIQDTSLPDHGLQPMITTFHGFCVSLLRDHENAAELPPDFTICSEEDVRKIVRRCLRDFKEKAPDISRFLKVLPAIKQDMTEGTGGSAFSPEERALYRKYQRRLREFGMLDLDDIQAEAVRFLNCHARAAADAAERYPWVFVDEYQDTNALQVAVLKAIKAGKASPGGLLAIGDPDQAVYGFRGADVTNFHRFSEDFPGSKNIVLNVNYRSTKSILKAAADLMSKPAPLESRSGVDDPVFIAECPSGASEAEMIVEQIEKLMGGISHFSIDSGRVKDTDPNLRSIGFGDIGVLFRLNAQGKELALALTRAGIPFTQSGRTSLTAQYPVNLIWRYLQTVFSPENQYFKDCYTELLGGNSSLPTQGGTRFTSRSSSLSGIVEWAIESHGLNDPDADYRDALDRFRLLAEDFQGSPAAFADTLSLERGLDHMWLPGDRVALMSLHAAKGLEWPIVFITGCEDRLLPCSLFGDVDEEEERRLFYVGMTRARRRLILSHASRRFLNSRKLDMKLSRFLTPLKSCFSHVERSSPSPPSPSARQMKLF